MIQEELNNKMIFFHFNSQESTFGFKENDIRFYSFLP